MRAMLAEAQRTITNDDAEFEALAEELATADRNSTGNPFSNPFLLFARRVTDRFRNGTLDLGSIRAAVDRLTFEAFVHRAERLRLYLDAGAAQGDEARLRDLFGQLADLGFDAYSAALAHAPLGIVATAHPTFALDAPLCEALVELATSVAADGTILDAAARDHRITLARLTPHRPPPVLNLDLEHAWSVRILGHAATALATARRIALEIARARWPDRWPTLTPALLTLATWVGFDQDGRTDISWDISFAKRLDLKRIALEQYLADISSLNLPRAEARLRDALERVCAQIDALAAALDTDAVAALAQRLIADRDLALCDPAPVIEEIEAALQAGGPDWRCDQLVALRATMLTQGISLAHIHVRVNATQLHDAIHKSIGLDTSPTDPASRRAHFAAVDELIAACAPQSVSFESLLTEPASAKRMFINIAQMAKFVDATSPVRFLIAETESGFTLLAALYFARLFEVEHLVEISPLFETQEALHRGEQVIEEALRSEHFRAYLRTRGRLAVQFGFSDSGRYIGQMAATFRIERLRLRLAVLLEREGLAGLEIILFNTHGESIGRGGHPATLQDRLAYVAPSRSRAEFARRGIVSREEDSFQGGDGYLLFFTPAAALKTVRGLLEFAYQPALCNPEPDDPIYDAPAYAAEFFATVEQTFSGLAADPDYPALLSLFGMHLLHKTGSRPEHREQEGSRRDATIRRASDLRAIPNNSILQGLAQLANTTFGVAGAAAKDLSRFEAMRAASPRFRRALAMVEVATALSDLQATRAYAATVNPSLWFDRRAGGLPNRIAAPLADLCERLSLTGRLSRVLRRMRAEPLLPAHLAIPEREAERRKRVRLLHAIRISLVQQAALLAANIPPFEPRLDIDREELRALIIRLDIPRAVNKLRLLFLPYHQDLDARPNFGEVATYLPGRHDEGALAGARLIAELEQVHDILLTTSSALAYEHGAWG